MRDKHHKKIKLTNNTKQTYYYNCQNVGNNIEQPVTTFKIMIFNKEKISGTFFVKQP